MDKYEVLASFNDKETGELISAGSLFSTDDKGRLNDMFERGLLKREEKSSTVKEPVKKEPVKKKVDTKKSGE